jgi:peptidoglycan lytic transglycosylase
VKHLVTAVLIGGAAALAVLPSAASTVLSPEDRQVYQAAFAAARSGDFAKAASRSAQAEDKLAAKVLRWMALTRGNGARFAEITDFIEKNPDWPSQVTLRQRAEEAMAGVPDSTLRAWFEKHKPVTPAGKLKEAELMIGSGQREAAFAQIRDVWINGDLNSSDEQTILQRFHGVLRSEDHVRRLDRLVWDGQVSLAKHMYRRVPADYRALAEARLALAAMSPGVERLISRVPAHLQHDPGLLYERLRWRRRKDQFDSALDIALNPPKELGRPQAWWAERQILARRAIADGKYRQAYRLTSKHGITDGSALSEAEFLSGWIALRFLKDSQAAYQHFGRLYDSAKLPISQARGAYWAGRAAEALHDQEQANAWYMKAAAHPTTYYGQLAHARLGDKAPPRPLPQPNPDRADFAAFNKRELVRAVRILKELGETDRLKPFVVRLSELSKTPVEHAMLATLCEDLGHPELAVSVAKRAGYAGVPLTAHGYPVISIPGNGLAERALVLAMTRQESAFDRDAVSKAGARGLMQLMPATARSLGVNPDVPAQAVDGAARLLADHLRTFNGRVDLALAAYNAGPGAVRKYGGVPPYEETRTYVQRVTKNWGDLR